MQQLTPVWSLRRTICIALFAMEQTHRVLIAASARAAKSTMEIREQDFSFSADGARERQVFEVVTKDVRTADIFNILEVIGGEEEIVREEAASWWKDAVIEEFSRQDVMLLALIAICALRVFLFVMTVTWNLIRLPMQWYNKLREGTSEDREGADTSSENVKKQLAIIRFCHLQFALVIEKLKRETREGNDGDVHHLVSSLVVPPNKDEMEVTLAEILAMLRSLQKMDSSFRASEVEEHLTNIRQDVEDETAIDSGLSAAWAELQETYDLFLRMRRTIACRRTLRKTGQWQPQQHRQHEQCPQEVSPRRQRRLSNREDLTDEVLYELQELTKELPQGFTADMFTSLGKAMHEQVAPS